MDSKRAGVRVGVEWEATGQKIRTSSYKINKFWGSNVQRGDYS